MQGNMCLLRPSLQYLPVVYFVLLSNSLMADQLASCSVTLAETSVICVGWSDVWSTKTPLMLGINSS